MTNPKFYFRLTPEQLKELELSLKIKKVPLTPDEKRIRRRKQAAWLSSQEWSVQEIAQRFNVSERSVWRWLKTYQEQGIDK